MSESESVKKEIIVKISLMAFLFVATAATVSVRGQDFVNLDFESAQVVFVSTNGTYQYIATANALPGWSAFNDTNQLSTIPYNPDGSGVWHVALVGSNSTVLGGNFSAVFGAGASISQTGLIPADTESLFFEAHANPLSGPLLVSLGGQNLSLVTISNAFSSYGLNYTVYGANVSAFAGQTEDLTFFDQTGGPWTIDDVQFSPETIPEPSGLALLLVGGGVLASFCVRCRFG
jgi:hypothetical protein